jgi:integrase
MSKFDPRTITVATGQEEFRAGRGLLLTVSATGNKRWWCLVIRNGKKQKHTLGHYPTMSLAQARNAREMVRVQVSEGHDPQALKRAVVAGRLEANAQTVERVGEDWLKRANRNWTPGVAKAHAARLRKYVYPVIGNLPIGEVTRDHVFRILELDKTHYAQATHVRGNLSALFDFAMAANPPLIQYNPVQRNSRWLPSRRREENPEQPHIHVSTIEDARAVLQVVEASTGRASGVLKLLHRLIALTGVRKVEATKAQWAEFNLAKAEWTLPAKRTKQRRDHVVPLSPQAMEVIQAAQQLRTLGARYVFPARPGVSDQPFSDSTLNDLYDRRGLQGKHTLHGWRSTFVTILNEQDESRYRLTDMMIGHQPMKASAAAAHYDHATHMPRRHALACAWADLLMVGAPPALALIGMEAPQEGNVVQLWKAA